MIENLDNLYSYFISFVTFRVGDYSVKKVGVIPEPEVFEHDISPDDQFIIMASDGVWEFISSQEAVDIVMDSLEYGALVACQELIETAAYRWQEIEGDYRDDVSICYYSCYLSICYPSYSLAYVYSFCFIYEIPDHCNHSSTAVTY